MSITKFAAAKINLLLDLGEKFDDGYHSIYTIMQSVDIYDKIICEKTDSGIVLESPLASVPLDERNTAYKAAKLFFDYTGITSGIKITIEKIIPMQAGMAGGSADAAGVLQGMNELFSTGLSIDELCDIGVKIGADVPFCITGGTRLCQNIGEVQARLPDFEGYYFVIVKPNSSVSTKLAYSTYDESDSIRHPDREWILKKFIERDYDEFLRNTLNVFEQVVLVPERADIKSILRRNGSVCEMMSGSGSAIFGLFKTKSEASVAVRDIKKHYGRVYLAEPVKQGVK